MELKPGYKLTEVGVIPEEWDISSVGEEFDIQLGKMLDAAKNTGVLKPYIANKSVQWGRFDIDNLPVMAMSASDIDRFRLKVGDLLVCEGGEFGRSAIWDAPIEECYYQKAIHRLRSRRGFSSKLMTFLLRYWIDSDFLCDYVSQTSIAHLTKERFSQVPLVLPPLPEQRSIATALSDMDELLGGLDRLITKKRDLKRSAMQQLITGKTRLSGFGEGKNYKQTEIGLIPEDWEVVSLGSCLLTRSDYGINAPAVPYSDRLPTYIRITDITEDGHFLTEAPVSVKSVNSKNYFLSDGDIVFARTGASVGKSYRYKLTDGSLVFAGFLIRIRPDIAKLLPSFVAAYVTTGSYWRWVRLMSMRSGQPGINGNEYSLLPIPKPSLPEQNAIASILSDMDNEITTLEQRRNKTRDLKQAMMQELLTGRIRLL